MIDLKDICYARLFTADIEGACDYATHILGLQPAGTASTARHFRSDARAHTLTYAPGDPADNVIGFELADDRALDRAGAALEAMGHDVRHGSRSGCEMRRVAGYIAFDDPGGTHIELAIRPDVSGRRFFPSRDAGIAGFNHAGLFSSDPVRDERFWTTLFNARVSDRIGDIPLLRIDRIHHSIALVPAPRSGIQHINHQVESVDDIQRSFALLRQHRVPVVFGPGRHPTSGARFLYFQGPDGMVFEYSVGVAYVDEDTHRERQFGFEPSSLCMWGSKNRVAEFGG